MRLGDRNFFNLFLRLAGNAKAGRDASEWEMSGVRWRRQRHAHWGAVSYQVETHELERPGRAGWKLIFVHEIWWPVNRRKAIRDVCWTHLESGSRRDALAWFAEQERRLDGA